MKPRYSNLKHWLKSIFWKWIHTRVKIPILKSIFLNIRRCQSDYFVFYIALNLKTIWPVILPLEKSNLQNSARKWQRFGLLDDSQWSLFSLKSRTFELGPTNWAVEFWGILGIFGQTINTHFDIVSSLSIYF